MWFIVSSNYKTTQPWYYTYFRDASKSTQCSYEHTPKLLIVSKFDPDNYNSSSLKVSQVYFNPPAFTDHVWVSIKLQGSDSLLVGCIYRSPLNTFLCDQSWKLYPFACLWWFEIVWSDLSGSSNKSHIEPFLVTIDDLFLFQHVSNPTRIRQDTTSSSLDLVFTNEKDKITRSI